MKKIAFNTRFSKDLVQRLNKYVYTKKIQGVSITKVSIVEAGLIKYLDELEKIKDNK